MSAGLIGNATMSNTTSPAAGGPTSGTSAQRATSSGRPYRSIRTCFIASLSAPLLLDVPQNGDGRGHEALDVLPRRRGLEPLSEVNVRWILGDANLDGLRDRLLLRRIRLARVLIPQPLDLRVARPAPHRLVAARVEEA